MNEKVTVRRHHGDYGRRDSKKAQAAVVRGTVVVRGKHPPPRMAEVANGYHRPKKSKEVEPEDIAYLRRVPERKHRHVGLTRAMLKEGLKQERKRERPFHLSLSEQFVAAFEEHLLKQKLERADVRVAATGVFPTNKASGTFYFVSFGGKEYTIPSRLISVHADRKPK